MDSLFLLQYKEKADLFFLINTVLGIELGRLRVASHLTLNFFENYPNDMLHRSSIRAWFLELPSLHSCMRFSLEVIMAGDEN